MLVELSVLWGDESVHIYSGAVCYVTDPDLITQYTVAIM